MDTTCPLYVFETFTWHDVQPDTQLIVRSNGKRFLIVITTETFKDSPPIQQQYLQYLKAIQLEDEPGDVLEDLEDWILQPFLTIFRALPPLLVESYTLQDYFSAETLSYTLRVAERERVPVPCDKPPSLMHMGVPLSPQYFSGFPVLRPGQVEIVSNNFDDRPTKVRINEGTNCFFKQLLPGDLQVLQNELKIYKRIQEASDILAGVNVRIPRLHGLVQGDDSSIIGLLLTFIDGGSVTLLCAVDSDTPKALRERWAHQITFTLKCLHKAGIVWGDVKADNVLIDANQDVWIIDFGGGYTEGWVEEQLAGTLEGDLQGLTKILEYLKRGSI